MERVSGLLTETSRRLDPEKAGKEVVRYGVGDKVYLPAQDIYARITGVRKSSSPHESSLTILTEVPSDYEFQRWCRANPNEVKLLVQGYCELSPNLF
jgi:hypothetical protein